MLSLEDQIKRYGDFLEGEALRGVELDLDAVEFQRGRSWFAIAAAVALVAGMGVFVAVGLNGGSPSEVVAVGEDEQITTREQMWLDHSDGIALEVVGDELWILGNGFGSPGAQAPFSIYVTGPEGELLRTIDLGRHFDQMGQSESYVWLVVDGTTQEKPDREPEVMRISKETGEMFRVEVNIASGGGPVAFDDDGAWFEVPLSFSSTLARWEWGGDTAAQVITLPERFNSLDYPVARSLIYHEGALFYGTEDGWIYKVSTDGEELDAVELSTLDAGIVDLESDDDLLWALQDGGGVTALDADLQIIVDKSCLPAEGLAVLPEGGVIVSSGFAHCVIPRVGEPAVVSLDVEHHQTQAVSDRAVFAGSLWDATVNIADHISTPLGRVAFTELSTHEQMKIDRSDGVALEVVGDELWILGGGSDEAEADAPFKIYVTGSEGELIRTIDVGRRFYAMTQSESYVWLFAGTTEEHVEPVSATVRVSKLDGELTFFASLVDPSSPHVFDDEGAWFLATFRPPEEPEIQKLGRWDTSDPFQWSFVEIPEVPEAGEVTHIVQSSGLIHLGTSDGWVYRLSSEGRTGDGVQLADGDSPVLDLVKGEGLVWVLQENGVFSYVLPDLDVTELDVCEGATELLTISSGVIALNGLESCVLWGDGQIVLAQVTPSPWEVADTAFFNGHVWYATSYEADRISYLVTYEIPIVID